MKKIIKAIGEINNYLAKCLWMDFDFTRIDNNVIKIIGSIDLSWKDYHSIEIEFHEAGYMSAILNGFSLCDDKPFIELINKQDFSQECGFLLTENDYCFRINIEDFDKSPIKIVAKSIEFKIIKNYDEGF